MNKCETQLIHDLNQRAGELLPHMNFDSLAVASINFKDESYVSFETSPLLELANNSSTKKFSNPATLLFDLASLTKALTNSLLRVARPDYFNPEMDLLLNHRAGLPSWGRLSKDTWSSQIESYPLCSSATLYSDFSSLRCMLELEKKTQKSLRDLVGFDHDRECFNWLDLQKNNHPWTVVPTGVRHKKIIQGEVHDDNAFVIKRYLSHAGLFSTVDGLARTLIGLQKKYDLLEQMKKALVENREGHRFVHGFDRPTDLVQTLAGKGIGPLSFGHLGFTGTSFWIDIEKKRGTIILTNATLNYWYEREGLTKLRKVLGELSWK